MQGLIWESLLSDSLVLRSQVAFMMPIPQHIYPAAVRRPSPSTCDHTPAVRNSSPAPQDTATTRQHHARGAIQRPVPEPAGVVLQLEDAG